MTETPDALQGRDGENMPEAVGGVPAIIDPSRAFMPVPMKEIEDAARMIAACPGLAKEFREAENCLAVAYQAARWGLDPIAVASKAYFANGRIGYEAQLIHALIEKNGDLREPLQFRYGYSDPTKKLAQFRFVEVIGWIRGASKPSKITTPTVAQIKIKNSPLWFSDPDQQLAYYGARAWARRYRPGALLGIYARDEVENIRVIDGDDTPRRPLFEEDEAVVIDAEFEDAPPPTEADEAHFARAQAKAEGKQDSRDPRDAEPEAPPAGSSEPEDMPAIRAWAAAEQAKVLAIGVKAEITPAWLLMQADKRWGRLKAYAPELAKTIHGSVAKRVKELEVDPRPAH